MASQNYNVNLNINANAQSAEKQLQNLQKQLQQISNMRVNVGVDGLKEDIEEASQAAMKLSAHLATATNPQTGNLDFTKFYTSIEKSGASLEQYGAALQKMGPAGQKAFVSLADSISKAEIPLKRTSKLVDGMWDNLKKTVGWQLSSSMVHGFIGSVQQAMGYAKDLNKSLTDIRIVTGQSADQMAQFAKQANEAAKNLSTTTTDYTKASLIYYQQGLNEAEVKARTETTIKMANATGTTAQTVSDQMTAIWNNYADGSKSLTHYADVMTALGAATASSTDEIAQGLQKFASISNTVGLSYEYAASALATITAESRESADVVGNALKTLFSRIQGLQLGETLEDGTTLNKYSTALAKVGISIKDQAGGLKDMDDILDEMGSKWDTLARDEKMALAQTVAGVRQYTQLMTLMENWDDFKKNLNVANTSAGTLDTQANIHAESWEAASNRVRAAWEGLWDNIIDSDSAIEVLDFISNMVKGLDNLVTGLGGAKGVLTAFGGIFTKIFAPKISDTIANTAYNLKMMLPGAQKRAEQQRVNMIGDLQNALKSGHLDIGTNESRVRNAAIEARLRESQNRAERERTLTAEEKIIDATYGSQLEANRQAQIKNAQEIDSAMSQRAKIAIDEIGTKELDSAYYSGGKEYKKMVRNQELYTNPDLDPRIGRPDARIVEQMEKEYYQNKESRNTGKSRRQVLTDTAIQNQNFINSINDVNTAKEAMTNFAKQTGQNAEQVNEWFNNLQEFSSEEEKLAHIREKATEMTNKNRDNIIDDMDANSEEVGLSSEELENRRKKYREYFDTISEIEAKKIRGEQLTEDEQRLLNERNKLGSKKVNWSDALTGAAQGLMSSVAALESLKSFANDPSLASFASVVSNSAFAFNGFTTMFKAMPGAIGKASSALAIGVLAFITAFDLIGEALKKHNNRFTDAAQQAHSSAAELQSAFQKNKNNHDKLISAVEAYKKSENALKDITLSSKQRAEAELEHNRMVMSMITTYNLQEGEYSTIGDQLKISEAGIDRITQESLDKMNASQAAMDAANVAAKEKSNDAEAERLRKQMTKAGGKADAGDTLLKIGGGLLAGALATAAVIAAPAVIAAVGAGAGIAAIAGTAATAVASSSVGGVLLGTAVTGVSAGILGARAKQDFESYNFADKAIEITKAKKGDTTWLNSIDTIMEEGFSEDRAKIIYQYRNQLESLSTSLKSAELAGNEVAKNAARNAVASNKAAEASEQQSKIVDGATKVYEDNYKTEKAEITKAFDGKFDSKAKKQELAEGVLDELGLSDLQGFEWNEDDKKNKRLTYTYIDEQGKVQDGAVTYDSIIEAQTSKNAITATQGYIDQSLSQYNSFKGKYSKDAAGGLLSLFTGGDFETATLQEIEAAKKILSQNNFSTRDLINLFGMEDGAEFFEKYGISANDFLNYYKNYQSQAQKLLEQNGDNTGYNAWAANNADIVNALSEKSAKQLYSNLSKISTLGGEAAGTEFLNGLTMMIKDTGIDESDYGKAIERLTAIDWSSASAASDAAAVISDLGGTLDVTSSAWKNFTNSMIEATNAIPDFTGLISQLTQLLGILGALKIGDVLDPEFVAQMIAKFPDFKDIIMKTWDGNYKLTGDPSKYEGDMQQDASNNYDALQNQKAAVDNYVANGGEKVDFTDLAIVAGQANNGEQWAINDPRMVLARALGYSSKEIVDANTKKEDAGKALDAWTGEGVTVGDLEGVTYDAASGKFLNNAGIALTGTQAIAAKEAYDLAVSAYQDASAIVDSIENNINNAIGMDYDIASEEAKEQYASTFNGADELLNAVANGDKLLTDNGIINEAALQQLKVLPETSERAAAAYDQLAIATENYNNAKETADTSDDAAAEAAYKEAEAQALLQATIDATAAARGLDADALAIQVEQMSQHVEQLDNESTADYHKRLVILAADYQENCEGLKELQSAYEEYQQALKSKDTEAEAKALNKMKSAISKITGLPINKITKEFIEWAKSSGLLEKALQGSPEAIKEFEKQAGKLKLTDMTTALGQAAKKVADESSVLSGSVESLWTDIESVLANTKVGDILNGITTDVGNYGDILNNLFQKTFTQELAKNGGDAVAAWESTCSAFENYGIVPTVSEGQPVEFTAESNGEIRQFKVVATEGGGQEVIDLGPYKDTTDKATEIVPPQLTFSNGRGGGSAPPSGGGGGGGGKKPKKTAQTRRSQVVKRYKNVDAQRATNKNRRDNLSKKTDKLYGESRITNLQKENKLLEEGLKLNEKKAEEALKNLKIDEESLRKMTKKYGYELELDSEGNIKNYEKILGDIYDEIHNLELDGELSEEEEKIKEELEIKKQEIEGAMEDWEDTLKQLEELNNEYEELIDEMHSNELEQITYKLEFELELNELDTEWYDFLNEQIGDDFTQAVDTMDLITEKIKIANDNINLYKQSVTDLMENIESDPNRSLITGYLEDGVLTDEEAEILKEAYSGIIEQLSALAEAKTSAEELLVSIFEGYKERIDFDTTALEHYTSLLEHFGNVVDIVGQKQLGLSDQFMENMAKMRIQQSRDIMSAAQSELAAYEQIRAEAEEELARAREEGRTNDIDYWQQQLDDANTSIQEARDKLVTSFEDNLNAIADAFDKAVERIVQTFGDAVYAFGGLEGLSEDYSFIRENTELMAQDYEKIYELSKLNRNINKTLNDNNIIAGKQKMIELQKEINDLQASGAELSKYDLEYLQAKYELRLAEIELENAQNAKETVRLSKDSEGNWSYVYTASTEKIDEAQQKYEDALYKMQNLSYEYIDEMSEKIISASQAMMEEIQNLNKNNFENEQEYLAEINRIKAKYAESLGVTEEELNKALANNEELYDKDWQSYSNKTGYAISESQNWIDRYAESTLGTLMKSTSDVADYMNNFSIALDELTNSIYRVAGDYYNGVDDAFAAAGITKEDFASFVTTNTKAIMDASANTKKDVETQTSALVKEYSIQADKITDVQRILDTAIDVYGPYIREIRDILRESAALTKELQNKDATYTYKQAADLFNSKYGEDYKIEMDAEGRWNKTVEGVKNEILQKHAEAKTDEEKKHYADMYTWLTSYILPYVTSLDTGGYTGEWGASGRLAMLHEKELILNANDTANFLDALNVSRELVNKVIEMNARASSFGIGGLSPSSIQDFAQTLEQQVVITAEFPNATDHNEIEEAFASLINTASQYANRN